MEFLNIDAGLKSYQFVEGGASLVFNPNDPNVYARFMDALDKIKAIEKEAKDEANAIESGTDEVSAAKASLDIMRETDRKLKEVLNGIFSGNADFDKILCGVNLMAIAGGKQIIERVIDALTPILEAGVTEMINSTVEESKMNRENRRAMNKK